jgi:hypothetical protein
VLRGREVDVLLRQAADERELEHLLKPGRAQGAVAEDPLEDVVERAQVEERLVDVEREDVSVAGHLGRDRIGARRVDSAWR